MTNNQLNYFAQLAAIDVNEHLEKKGQFSYLSWPYAVAQLRMFDETATWDVIRFDGLPFLSTEYGTLVEVAVTVRGITLNQIHPVLDNKNLPIQTPTVFDINTSIQRCLVKAIALHGLGINVYAGEDLSNTDSQYSALTTLSKPTQLRGPFRAALEKIKHENRYSNPELLTANQLRYVKRLIQETKTDVDQLLTYFDFNSLEEIPKHQVNRVIQALENHRQQDAA